MYSAVAAVGKYIIGEGEGKSKNAIGHAIQLRYLQTNKYSVPKSGQKGRPQMENKFTFKEYWDALDPASSTAVKENILRGADNDPSINCLQFKQLVDRAYPDQG